MPPSHLPKEFLPFLERSPTLALIGDSDVPTGSFVTLKDVYGGALAALVSPLIAWWALVAASTPQPT